MNQTHEAIRWMHQEKGRTAYDIARSLKLETASVNAILRKLGIEVKPIRMARDQFGPKVYPTPVDRDPCSYCGTRADIGCKHNRRAA